uniref:Non-specific lipid-transfer protein n=2 Tax=Oryza TaxID=4527 RepID=A0A0E0BMZ5_9ORYZ
MAAVNCKVVVAVIVVAMVVAAPGASAAITCGQVGSAIAPCISYVTGRSGLTQGCCNGVKELNNAARATADRQAACRCLKTLAGSIKSLNLGTVAGVPGKCGVNVGFPISLSTDCNNMYTICVYYPAMRRLGDVVEAPALVLTPASMQQAGGRGSSGALDASMVVILAALLCVVICALGLTSLIRCALHCARGLSPTTATPTPSVSTAATAGLKKTELRRIPVEVYGAKQAGVPDGECAICLGDFADGDKVRVLPRCHHGFHVRCIDTWLAAHTSCPTCRDSILSVHGVVAGGQT